MKIIECPRDAMQGIHAFIPTNQKVAYINQLLKVGFDTIDFGSFVSPKAVPQMQDSAQVLESLDLDISHSKLLAIVANTRGAKTAAAFDGITYLGFPLSISETFQQRNTNQSISEALITLQGIQEICLQYGKTLVTYISMGFGNPYDDPYDVETVLKFVRSLDEMQVEIIALSDTIGIASPKLIDRLFSALIPAYPGIEFGAHLHSHPKSAEEKIASAYQAGCRRFDGALKGYGGCPMAKDELVGNLATEKIIGYLKQTGFPLPIEEHELERSLEMATALFPA